MVSADGPGTAPLGRNPQVHPGSSRSSTFTHPYSHTPVGCSFADSASPCSLPGSYSLIDANAVLSHPRTPISARGDALDEGKHIGDTGDPSWVLSKTTYATGTESKRGCTCSYLLQGRSNRLQSDFQVSPVWHRRGHDIVCLRPSFSADPGRHQVI